jgi:hypothetical protein
VFFPHLIASDLQSLQGVGKGEFIEAESNVGGSSMKIDGPGMTHLNLYVTARLFWNPNLNVDDLLSEYYDQFYGPARKPMEEFWTTAESIWMTKSPLGDPVNVFTKADLDHLSVCLDQAVANTAAESVYRKRVELIQAEFMQAKRKLSNVLVANPPTLSLTGPVPAVKIDGLLDDAAWQNLEPFGFVDNSGEMATQKTWGYAAWDQENLYFAFLNYEPEMDKLVAQATQRDQNYGPGMWEDDSVELFISPNPADKTKMFQFIINAKAQIWDARIEGNHEPDVHWNSSAEAKARLESNRWILEVRIPLKDLGLSGPMEGKSVLANFYRNRYSGGPVVYSCWSPTLTIQHANPQRFGTIEFKSK